MTEPTWDELMCVDHHEHVAVHLPLAALEAAMKEFEGCCPWPETFDAMCTWMRTWLIREKEMDVDITWSRSEDGVVFTAHPGRTAKVTITIG